MDVRDEQDDGNSILVYQNKNTNTAIHFVLYKSQYYLREKWRSRDTAVFTGNKTEISPIE